MKVHSPVNNTSLCDRHYLLSPNIYYPILLFSNNPYIQVLMGVQVQLARDYTSKPPMLLRMTMQLSDDQKCKWKLHLKREVTSPSFPKGMDMYMVSQLEPQRWATPYQMVKDQGRMNQDPWTTLGRNSANNSKVTCYMRNSYFVGRSVLRGLLVTAIEPTVSHCTQNKDYAPYSM